MNDTHDNILSRMAEGFARFQERWYLAPDAPYTALLGGQSPQAMVIACSDSRVDPALVLDAEPGELFMVRNVANLVPPYEPDNRRHGVSAALEYAVRVLKVPDIIVMGHARCGGIANLLSPDAATDMSFIHVWMELADEAMRRADSDMPDAGPEERSRACAMWGIRLSLRNLMSFPWIRDRVEHNTLRLHGLYFDLDTGTLLRFDPSCERFVSLVAGPGAEP